MSILDIRVLGDPVLRKETGIVEDVNDDIRTLINDMFETMYAAEGIGLAAPQVGRTERITVMDVEGAKFALVNPEIVDRQGTIRGEEGCLSIPDVFGEVERSYTVTVRALNERGEEIEIVGFRPTTKTIVTGVEMFRKLLDEGRAGDNVGCLLRGLKREDVERGQVLAKPGSITPHKKFKAEVYILTKEEGGRHTPFFTKYRPQFYFRTTDVTGIIQLPKDVEMVMPGDSVTITAELITPIAMEKELRFAIREGGRTVGAGVISEILG